MRILRLILGDQLNSAHSWYRNVEHDVLYVLMEIRQETDYVKHHIQKLLTFFAAMRYFARQLEEKGHHVLYLSITDPRNTHSLTGNLGWIIQTYQIDHLQYQLPDEWLLDQQLKNFREDLAISCQVYDSEHFLTRRDTLSLIFNGKKQYLMETFYRMMRHKFNLLIDKGKPLGGKWNFDAENRAQMNRQLTIPPPLLFSNDVLSLRQEIDQSQIEHFGEADPQHVIWPVNRTQALQTLDYFAKNLLPYFGTYQDTMPSHSWSVFHSRLSFALNSKMLHPMEVVNRAITEWETHPDSITLQQIEGFIRQIIGWREYMRGIYWARMPDYQTLNFFDHDQPLPDFYWTGKTEMNCLRVCVGQSLKYAYAHHIQRLMITGNFALLAGIHPDEVDRWYLGIYIDAIQWVEITNTRGMSQFADGGVVGTKPYISTANYIDRMSDYCHSCHYDKSKRYGNRACPFNPLYWDFYHRHRSKLEKNRRVAVMYRTLENMDDDNRQKILAQAAIYRQNLNNL